jgi:cysteine-rich repeat protein
MRSFVERRSVCVVLACGVLFACGSDDAERELARHDRTPERLQVALVVPEEATLDEVLYTVAHPDNGAARTGRSKLSTRGKFDLQLALPPGSGYSMQLTGTTRAGALCAARARFDVVDGAIMTLPLSMHCDGASPSRERGRGSVHVNAVVSAGSDPCPDVSGIGAAPLDVPVGAGLKIEGFTTSPSQTRWSFAGLVAAPYAWTTRAYCTEVGSHTLSFEALSPGCPRTTESIDITCTEGSVARCGNGLQDANEECDDGNVAAGDGCSNCRREPPACAADFACFARTTFCVGTTQMRKARTIPCAELCGTDYCVGAGCGPTGPAIDCPTGEVCVDDQELPYWESDARCLPLPSECEDTLCSANYRQCGRGAPAPESCSQACTAGFCCTWRANDWEKVAVDCGGQ